MKTESFQETLLISGVIRLSAYAAPVWIFVVVFGCSSRLDIYPASMKATEGSVPFCTSFKYCETGTTLLGSGFGGEYLANWVRYVQAPEFEAASAIAESLAMPPRGPASSALGGGPVAQMSSV